MRAMWVGALMLGAACTGAPRNGVPVAESVASAPSQHAELEAIFWHCDYVATTQGMDATPAAQCAAATRELRRVKFDGSFQRMLAWWRENKPAEHRRIALERNETPL
jgi:hypothetical protein